MLPTHGWPVRVPAYTVKAVWMRAPSPSGGKEWVGIACPCEFIAHWGKIGIVVQKNVVQDHQPLGLLARKLAEKTRKGYKVIAVYKSASPSPTPTTTPPPKRRESPLAKVVRALQEEVSAEEEWF